MSTLSDENSWCSIADLLAEKIPVAKLATAIEEEGVHTYDRFGRRVFASGEDEKSNLIKSKALDLLANYYALAGLENLIPGADDLSNSPELYSSLQNYGWLKDKLPKFENIPFEVEPESVRKSRALNTEPGTRVRRTYLTIIAALCKRSKISYERKGAAKKIASLTEASKAPVSEDTVLKVINEIPDALETRTK